MTVHIYLEYHNLEDGEERANALVSPCVPADTIICCQVIEHLISLPKFFHHHVSRTRLTRGGLLVLANMHPHIGWKRGQDV